MEWKGEERESRASRRLKSAYYLEAGAGTQRVLQRLNVLVLHSYCHGLSHRPTSVPGPMVRPSSGGHAQDAVTS